MVADACATTLFAHIGSATVFALRPFFFGHWRLCLDNRTFLPQIDGWRVDGWRVAKKIFILEPSCASGAAAARFQQQQGRRTGFAQPA